MSISPAPELMVKVCVPALVASIPPSPSIVMSPPLVSVSSVVLPARTTAPVRVIPPASLLLPVVLIIPFVFIVAAVRATSLISVFKVDPLAPIPNTVKVPVPASKVISAASPAVAPRISPPKVILAVPESTVKPPAPTVRSFEPKVIASLVLVLIVVRLVPSPMV